MRKQSLILLALLPWTVALAVGAAQRPAPAPRVKPAVQALLQRAGKESPAAALTTLHEAQALAQSRKDRAGLLAVAAMAHRLGEARYKAADYAAGEQFHRLALAMRERLVPGTPEHAGRLLGLA